jgi:hypothetical protein
LNGRIAEFLAVPGRRRQLLVVAGALVALIGAFELGQLTAGHNALQARLAESRLARRAGQIEAENREVSAKLARLETDARVDREAYAQVEQQLGELQGKIIEQQEELAFYRGVIGGPGEGGLQVQDFAVTAAESGKARLRFVLAQPERAERYVQGRLQIRVEGTRAGRLVSLDAAAMGAAKSLDFGFRYFQDVTLELGVPADFTPQRIVIRVLPATRGIRESVVSFPWGTGTP